MGGWPRLGEEWSSGLDLHLSSLIIPALSPPSVKGALVSAAPSKGPRQGRRADGWAAGQAEGGCWVGAGPGFRAGMGGDPHLPLPPEELTAMTGADTPGGRRAGGVWGFSAAPPPEEALELPTPLPLIAWQSPSPMWPFLKMIKAA